MMFYCLTQIIMDSYFCTIQQEYYWGVLRFWLDKKAILVAAERADLQLSELWPKHHEASTHSLELGILHTHTHFAYSLQEHLDVNRFGFVAKRLLRWKVSHCHLWAKQTGALARCWLDWSALQAGGTASSFLRGLHTLCWRFQHERYTKEISIGSPPIPSTSSCVLEVWYILKL